MSAYDAGYRAGRADRRLGFISTYAYYGAVLDAPGTYSHAYSLGYRAAVN